MSRLLRRLIVLSLLATNGCAIFLDRPPPPTVFGVRERSFAASFDEVWKAVNLVLQPYPLRTSNMDQGVLETDMIRGSRVWTPPYLDEKAEVGGSYKLSIKVIKGNFEGRPATKVTILKDSQRQSDFFSEPRQLPSDGLEEQALLYRVGREITIERGLAKAQKRQNQRAN